MAAWLSLLSSVRGGLTGTLIGADVLSGLRLDSSQCHSKHPSRTESIPRFLRSMYYVRTNTNNYIFTFSRMKMLLLMQIAEMSNV